MKEFIKKINKQPRLILLGLIKHLGIFVTDKLFLSIIYRLKTGSKICWNNPKSFNEKIQWLKLYDRKPEYTIFVDKYKVRDYILKTIGEKYLIPLIGVWDNPDEIDFDKLPNQFVLKCNHNSGLGMCICKDKSKLDIEKVKRELKKGLEEDYYLAWREWPYKNVPRKIIAEKYMVDESGFELKDYKIFCFNGEPKFIQVDFDRFVNHMRNLYTTDWQYIKAKIEYPTAPDRQISKPKVLDEMLDLARNLSKGIPHVRTDFYCIDNKVYFGEMTFYHGSGFEHFEPAKYGLEIGSWINLPMEESRNKNV